LHEAAHAVFHASLVGTCCCEVHVWGSGKYEEAFTVSCPEGNEQTPAHVRAIAALAGPAINALAGQASDQDERLWLWRGTLGDYVKAASLVAKEADILALWDSAVALAQSLRPAIEAVADLLANESRLTEDHVDAAVRAYPPLRPLPSDMRKLIKPDLLADWDSDSESKDAQQSGSGSAATHSGDT
jgi:hypothetical protein